MGRRRRRAGRSRMDAKTLKVETSGRGRHGDGCNPSSYNLDGSDSKNSTVGRNGGAAGDRVSCRTRSGTATRSSIHARTARTARRRSTYSMDGADLKRRHAQVRGAGRRWRSSDVAAHPVAAAVRSNGDITITQDAKAVAIDSGLSKTDSVQRRDSHTTMGQTEASVKCNWDGDKLVVNTTRTGQNGPTTTAAKWHRRRVARAGNIDGSARRRRSRRPQELLQEGRLLGRRSRKSTRAGRVRPTGSSASVLLCAFRRADVPPY